MSVPGRHLTPEQEAAFRAHFDAHADRVYAFLLRLCRDHHLAEDLFQETWCAAAQSYASLEAGRPLLPWLFTTARNQWRMHRRWAWVDLSRWLVAEPDLSVADDAPGPAARAQSAEDGRRLEHALLALGERDREVLLLFLDDGLTSADRASVLGISETAWRQRLHRARQALQHRLDAGGQP